MSWYIVHFSGSGLSVSRSRFTQEKCVHVVSRLHDSLFEWPRTAESGLLLLNETEYSFGDFMARNTPYFRHNTLELKAVLSKISVAYTLYSYLDSRCVPFIQVIHLII